MSPSATCFDLQLNGYAGVDFQSADLSADALHGVCERLRADGVGGFLATIITDHLDRMCASLRRLRELRERNPLAKQMIAGFHIEGPFINETDGYRGAHPRDAVIPASAESAARLMEAAGGLVRIVTLAPECDRGLRTTRYLADNGVIVSAGHTNASLDELRSAIDAGLRMFTHVGNGCPMQMHRHDNILQRALSLRDRLWLTFIADGVHIPLYALANYLRCAGIDRGIVVTDGIAAAGLGPGRYTLGRWDLVVGEDQAAWAPDRSHLVGSACTMPQAERNLLRAGVSQNEVDALIRDNPRRALAL